jgi:Tfp pilus assembly protein PilV
MSTRPCIRAASGFILIEAMVAAFILAVALLGLARLQGGILTANAESRMRTHALNLAQEKIEELRTFANQTAYAAIGSGSDSRTGENAIFTRTWASPACANSVPCKVLTVTVTWTDSKGITQTVILTSYVARIDPVKGGVALLAL